MMPDRDAIKPGLRSYRCGASLAALSLPLARLDLCPACGVELHVCRMCSHYAPTKPDACDEEDAIPVHKKTTANFCDYFSPDAEVFDGREKRAETEARHQLGALFGDAGGTGGTGGTSSGTEAKDALQEAADKLFRK
jgi:hypothetical protein